MPYLHQTATSAQLQLAADNARDLDAFMACWHPDAELMLIPATVLATGITEIRARHAVRYAQTFLHAAFVSRHVAGAFISYREFVTRLVDGKSARSQ